MIIPLILENEDRFHDGLIKVWCEIKRKIPDVSVEIKDYRYGYMDKTGKEVIPCIYGGAWDFHEGIAKVCENEQYSSKYGFIDKSGNMIIPIVYDYASYFSEGLAVVKKGDKWGVVDKTGKSTFDY